MKANSSNCESVEDIKQRVSHAELLAHYLGISSLPVLINSPFRKDKHPSFYIYSPDSNKVLYKDYATNEEGDIYSLLQRVENLSFSQLIQKIAAEKAFQRGDSQKAFSVSPSNGRHFKKSVADVKVKIREWEKHDIEYWESYGIPLKWLKFADVYPISHKIIYKDGERYVFHAAKYAYVFVEKKEGNVTLKIYQPFNKNFKWLTNNDGSVVGLWTKIPFRGDKLIICSSLKDALCLWVNIGIPAIYVQSETTSLSATAQDVLRKRFTHIFICFDNDAPGLKDGRNLSMQTGFRNVVLPQFPEGKDVSDLYKARGKEKFIKKVKPLFE